ncbi:MAG: hypothetical protein WC895_00345 [Candidatus Shapirobacteria bacterium]|jgi:hypothetical protein
MKNKITLISIIGTIVLIIITIVIVIINKNKTNTKKTSNNFVDNTQRELILTDNEKPIISLIPREDGHELKLKIDNISSIITQIEYELIYSAQDNGLEMEKGVGDTVKITSKNIEKDLLLGTSSCTNGCKYKYDEGITSGTLSLSFSTDDNQSVTYESQFILKTSSDIKKDGGLSLTLENFEIKASTTTKNDYFILIKNFNNFYSVFSNGTGAGKISSISPDSVTKENKTTLVGNYLIN